MLLCVILCTANKACGSLTNLCRDAPWRVRATKRSVVEFGEGFVGDFGFGGNGNRFNADCPAACIAVVYYGCFQKCFDKLRIRKIRGHNAFGFTIYILITNADCNCLPVIDFLLIFS